MLKKTFIISFLIIILFSLILIFSQESFAALNYQDSSMFTERGAEEAGVSKASDPAALAASIISALLSLVGVLFFIIFIYGSFMWMTAAGNEEKVGQAKRIIATAIAGMAIISLAYVISFFIIQALEQGAV